MIRRNRLLVLLVSWLLLPVGGCSWLLVKGPPEGPDNLESVECTESLTAPVLDGMLGALGVIAGVYVAISSEMDAHPLLVGAPLAVPSAGLAGWSAYTGFRRVEDCRDVKRALQLETGGRTAPHE